MKDQALLRKGEGQLVGRGAAARSAAEPKEETERGGAGRDEAARGGTRRRGAGRGGAGRGGAARSGYSGGRFKPQQGDAATLREPGVGVAIALIPGVKPWLLPAHPAAAAAVSLLSSQHFAGFFQFPGGLERGLQVLGLERRPEAGHLVAPCVSGDPNPPSVFPRPVSPPARLGEGGEGRGSECRLGETVSRFLLPVAPLGKPSVKMERHSVQASIETRKEVGSPIVALKYSSFRDFCPTPSLQDRGYHELLKSSRINSTAKDTFQKKQEGPTQEYPETSSLGLTQPFASPSQKKKFFSRWRERENTPELGDIPKITRKKCLLRRRLSPSFALLQGDFESQNSSVEGSISQVLNVGKNIPTSASGFLRENNFSPLVRGSDTEETTSSSQKLRLNFSQHKTSTVDESNDDCGLFVVECISPIQGNTSQDSITCDYSDSSLSINDENTYPELLGSSASGITCATDEDIFVTPISNLVAKIKFSASKTLSSSTEVKGNASTPEDSGFNSLSLDKSEDSFSDQESSFQELLQKHKGALKVGDTIRKSRHLGRSRRLSTLQEQSSQSETEEEKQTIHSDSENKLATGSNRSQSQLNLNNENGDLVLSFKNLSNTPALELVHELFMNSKRKRSQEDGVHECLEQGDGGKIAILQCVLAGLIGKKMGIEKLDILTELKYRNLKHILAIVLESLTAESLCSIWRVSRNWREIVTQDKKANRRRKFYITQLKADSEGTILNVEDAATRLNLLNRSALRSVQAQATMPGFQKEQVPILSPWGEVLTPVASSSVTPPNSKQEEYVKVAKTLFIDEALKPCPRCQSPAKYQPYKRRGLCSRTACGFDFCVLCLCAYHGSEECSSGAAKPRNRKDTLPGSAQSKRNLKRL
ncbi:F-box only protein 43 [Rhynchocyon petersi]